MKLSSCCGFLVVGAVMFFWPEWRQGLPFLGLKANDQDLWLRLMGLLQLFMGGGFFLGQSAQQVGRWLRQWPQELPGVQLVEQRIARGDDVRPVVTERGV